MNRGVTIIELMMTIVIVVILSVTVGTFLVRMLKLHESNREEGYMREKLALICGEFAEYLSMGNSVSTVSTEQGVTNLNIGFRMEMDGASFETGKVSRVSGACVSVSNGMFNLSLRTSDSRFERVVWEDGIFLKKQSLAADGMLMNVLASIEDFNISPPLFLGVKDENPVHLLTITATNHYYDLRGNTNAVRRVTARRAFRLWNVK